MTTDYDSPWKEALELYFRAFVQFFYPLTAHDIDWARGYEMLDKELQKIAPQSIQGRRYVDKLVKVWRRNGRAVWVLIHIEVQTQRERGFMRRMYRYNTRIEAHFDRTVVSLIVLADSDTGWRPSGYRHELWGWSARMMFPAVKLLDWVGREEELEADRNPFAKVVLSHLKALETRRDPESRRLWKFRLVRGLYEQGFKAKDVRQLFRLIDWLMELPVALDEEFWDEMQSYQETQKMPFLTTPERIGIKMGLLRAIEIFLHERFGEEGLSLVPDIKALNDREKYEAITKAILHATSLEEVRAACAAAASPEPAASKTKSTRSKRKKS